MKLSVRQTFGIESDLEVPAYSKPDPHVPDIDADYQFNREVTLAILAGFKHNRRVMIQGYHGTGKSTHIEQVAARLNWPCVRINLDSHVSRIDPSAVNGTVTIDVALDAPLPPGAVKKVRPLRVSPAAGRRGVRTTRSMLMLPRTTTAIPQSFQGDRTTASSNWSVASASPASATSTGECE